MKRIRRKMFKLLIRTIFKALGRMSEYKKVKLQEHISEQFKGKIASEKQDAYKHSTENFQKRNKTKR